MAKAVQRREKDKLTSLFHCGLIKIIIQHELRKQNLTWTEFLVQNQFEEQEELHEEVPKEEELLMITCPEATSSKLPKDKKKKEEVLLIPDDEDSPEATSSKPPQRRIRTRSAVKEDKQFQKQEQIFTTYQRKPRKKQVHSQPASEDEEHPQTVERQEEDLADEIGQGTLDTDEIMRQTKKINLFLDQQEREREKEKQSRQGVLKDLASPSSEPQIVQEEKKEGSEQGSDSLGADTSSVKPSMKKKTSKKNKEIRKLKLEIKELELKNEKLKKDNRKLRIQRTHISKTASRWYKQKKNYKAKYERLKVLYASPTSTDASSQ
jgi:hypothetical protein